MQASDQISHQLQARLKGIDGRSIFPGDTGYEEARKVWNGMIDKHPAVVVECASEADVVRAIAAAADTGVPLAVRGGGHNVAGKSVCDGGVVIDLAGLDTIDIDSEARLVRAGGGLTWGELDAATDPFGLHAVGGVVSTTGVGGLTLGGGFGWLSRMHGMSCDNLVSARVVTADGSILVASETENPDLFWGIRGGGGNFGVVTEFTFRLHPATTVLAGLLLHPAQRAGDVLRFYRDFVPGIPNELTVYAGLLTAPDGNKVCGNIVFYNGEIAEGERLIQPLRDFGPPVADLVGPVPYVDHQKLLDAGYPAGPRSYWKSSFLNELTDEGIDSMIANFEDVPSPHSAILIEQFGGAVFDTPVGATAYPHRSAPFNLLSLGVWNDPDEDDRNIAWGRKVWQSMQPWAQDAVYVNYLGDDESDRIAASAYGSETFARLQQVKQTYDPGNVFRINQNVVPVAAD